MKSLKILSKILIIILALFIFYEINANNIKLFLNEDKKINNESNLNQNTDINIKVADEIKEINETKLYFVGDIMLARGVESSIKKNFNNDFSQLFVNLENLKDADILFGNLEGPVSDVGNNVGSKYSFRMNPIVLIALKNAGFDIVSFANNHVGDWNLSAFKDTLLRLKEYNILYSGAGLRKDESVKPTVINKNGINFGYLAFSDVGPNWMEAKEDKPGILIASDPDFETIIKDAKNKTDILIISFHWGEEYKLIHNSRQEKLAHDAIDFGADLIIGHHPHVIQDIEFYKGKPIVYSLGNFIFDQYFSKNTMEGMLFIASFSGTNLVDTEIKTISLNKKFQPEGIFTEEEVNENEEITKNSCPKPTREYEDMWLLPIGQEKSLYESTYVPANLRELNTESSTKKICLTKEARDSFELMISDAKKDGYTIKASSGFRNYGTQKTILENEIKSGNPNAEISVAKAGHSEHQLGTAVDITGQSIEYISASKSFEKTDESKWVEENASKYGFIKSYPKGKEDITGYQYEPWHYRYVGIDIAKEIIKSEQTTIEYLESL